MSRTISRARAPFSRGGAAALVVAGFVLFAALLALAGRGENPLAETQDGGAHASAKGLNGYAGLARLLAANGYRVTRSRSAAALEGGALLVLTPPPDADPETLGNLLMRRQSLGPTLVIAPKWRASLPPRNLPREDADRFERGWVVLSGATTADWAAALPAPLRFNHRVSPGPDAPAVVWNGLGLRGSLPTSAAAYAELGAGQTGLIRDEAGRVLALSPAGGTQAYPLVFLAEPDLANNYGMADPARAAAALALVRWLDSGGDRAVTFDLTLNGFGGSENLLTLALRPPFLAATLCLALALALVLWRALLRFGPAAASASAEARGKRQLVANGAALILRARRWRLLAAPYARTVERRLARRLGTGKGDAGALDAALTRRSPEEEPVSRRIVRLANAATPSDILSAARALDTLTRKLDR